MVVKRIADSLLGAYYKAYRQGGYMHNPCGVGFRPRDYTEGHERRTKVMAWMLQGLEAAFCHSMTILSSKSEHFTVVANEHDGLIIEQECECDGRFLNAVSKAQEVARLMSGFHRAKLVQKPHADEEDIQKLYGRIS
jgi:hypothetical protein